jgi:Trypsin
LIKNLQAAHCIQNKEMEKSRHPNEIVVKIGKFDLSQTFERGSVIAYPFDIIVHPNWKYWTKDFDSDIALIVLEEKVQLSDSIFPICLWDKPDSKLEQAKGIVVGWGKSGNEAKHQNKPRELEIEIRSNEDCFLKNPRFAAISSRNTFCAGKDEFSGPCQGKKILFLKNCLKITFLR